MNATLIGLEIEKETLGFILKGLRAPWNSGQNRYARFLLLRMFGPSSLSVVFSVLVVLAAMCVSSMPRGSGRGDPGITTFIITPEEMVKVDTPVPEPDEDVYKPVPSIKPPEVNMDTSDLLGSPESATSSGEISGAETGPSGPGNSPDLGGDDISTLSELAPRFTQSPVTLRGVYAGRTKAGQGKALAAHSRSGVSTEVFVRRALGWLVKHQQADGSWGPYYRVGMTGLALLTFLAHGEGVASREYGDTVRRGLRYLIRTQRNGQFVGGGPGNANQINPYEHAIGTYAISEAYTITGIPDLKPVMEDAVQVIIDGQNMEGGWDYAYKVAADANVDVSLSGWHIQALEAALKAGAENRGLKTALEGGVRGLKFMLDKRERGLFKYSTRAVDRRGDFTMTGVAVLCMQLTGYAISPEAMSGMMALQKFGAQWTKGTAPGEDRRQVGEWPFYSWYYIVQAKFQKGGDGWERWDRQFAPMLCGAQNSDGSWCPPPQSTEGFYGPVYCTALSTLMLEVYYRLLPTFEVIQVENTPPPKDDAEEFVISLG